MCMCLGDLDQKEKTLTFDILKEYDFILLLPCIILRTQDLYN